MGLDQGRRTRRGVGRRPDSVSTAISKPQRNSSQKADKRTINGKRKHQGSKDEQRRLDERHKEGEEQGEEYVCPACLKSANYLVVECGKCEKWYHFTCVGLEDQRDTLHEIEWACEACAKIGNLSDEDVFVDSVGAPAHGGGLNPSLAYENETHTDQLVLVTPATSCLTRDMDGEHSYKESASGQESEHESILHEAMSVSASINVHNMQADVQQSPNECSTKEPGGPQQQRTGTDESEQATGSIPNVSTDNMLVFSTCEDLGTELELRMTAPKPCMSQDPSTDGVNGTCKDLGTEPKAREPGRALHGDTTAPKPYVSQDPGMGSMGAGLETELNVGQAGKAVHRYTATPVPYVARDPDMVGTSVMSGQYLEPESDDENKHEVQIPDDTVDVFLGLAAQNTSENIETLGILAGKAPSRNILVTHLIVPRQKGDSVTCECIDEELLVATLQRNGLVQVGWIHTHPNHSTFLSSIDVHTQLRLQCDIPGAVAIVHSHRDGQTGHFRLTEKGMRDIASCQEDGFHEGCARSENWGTVQIQVLKDSACIQAIDLRKEQDKPEQTKEMNENMQQKQAKAKHESEQEGKVTEEVAQMKNHCLALNSRHEGPSDMGGSDTAEQATQENICFSAQTAQQEACPAAVISSPTQERNGAMSKRNGRLQVLDSKHNKRKQLAKKKVDMAEQIAKLQAENQALRVEVQQLKRGPSITVDQENMTTHSLRTEHRMGQALCPACAGYLLWISGEHKEKSNENDASTGKIPVRKEDGQTKDMSEESPVRKEDGQTKDMSEESQGTKEKQHYAKEAAETQGVEKSSEVMTIAVASDIPLPDTPEKATDEDSEDESTQSIKERDRAGASQVVGKKGNDQTEEIEVLDETVVHSSSRSGTNAKHSMGDTSGVGANGEHVERAPQLGTQRTIMSQTYMMRAKNQTQEGYEREHGQGYEGDRSRRQSQGRRPWVRSHKTTSTMEGDALHHHIKTTTGYSGQKLGGIRRYQTTIITNSRLQQQRQHRDHPEDGNAPAKRSQHVPDSHGWKQTDDTRMGNRGMGTHNREPPERHHLQGPWGRHTGRRQEEKGSGDRVDPQWRWQNRGHRRQVNYDGNQRQQTRAEEWKGYAQWNRYHTGSDEQESAGSRKHPMGQWDRRPMRKENGQHREDKERSDYTSQLARRRRSENKQGYELELPYQPYRQEKDTGAENGREQGGAAQQSREREGYYRHDRDTGAGKRSERGAAPEPQWREGYYRHDRDTGAGNQREQEGEAHQFQRREVYYRQDSDAEAENRRKQGVAQQPRWREEHCKLDRATGAENGREHEGVAQQFRRRVEYHRQEWNTGAENRSKQERVGQQPRRREEYYRQDRYTGAGNRGEQEGVAQQSQRREEYCRPGRDTRPENQKEQEGPAQQPRRQEGFYGQDRDTGAENQREQEGAAQQSQRWEGYFGQDRDAGAENRREQEGAAQRPRLQEECYRRQMEPAKVKSWQRGMGPQTGFYRLSRHLETMV